MKRKRVEQYVSKKKQKNDESLREDLWQEVQSIRQSNKLFQMIFPKRWEPLYLFLCHYAHFVVQDEGLAQLLRSCLICVPPDAPPLPEKLTFEQTCNQTAIVDRVISSLFQNSKKSPNSKHVLTFGYGTPRPGSEGIVNLHGVQVFFPNTIVTTVKSAAWETLLSKIGDMLMMHILTHCIILMQLPNECFIQLTGKPLEYYVKESNLRAKRGEEKYVVDLKRNQFYRMHIKPLVKRDYKTHKMMKSQEESKIFSSQYAESSNHQVPENAMMSDQLSGEFESTSPIIAKSPSSVESIVNIVPQELSSNDDTVSIDFGIPQTSQKQTTAQKKRKRKNKPGQWRRKRIKQKKEMQKRVEDVAVEEQPKKAKEIKKERTPKFPSFSLSLNSIFIDRVSVFYAGPTRLIQGLPYKNILNQIPEDTSGANMLYHYIFKNTKLFKKKDELNDFDPTKPMLDLKAPKKGKQQVNKNKEDDLTEKKIDGFEVLLSLLKKVKTNQQKIAPSIRYLLNHHCKDTFYDQESTVYDTDKNKTDTNESVVLKTPPALNIVNEGEVAQDWNMIDDELLMSQLTEDDIQKSSNDSALQANFSQKLISEESEQQISHSLKFERMIRHHLPYSSVSGFVKSVCKRIIPREMWGSKHNAETFLTSVDRFVCLGRYEGFSLNVAAHGFRVNDCSWTFRHRTVSADDMASAESFKHEEPTSFLKRSKMVHHFIYFCFDSIVIPLLRSYFYCTESNGNRTSAFYFRRSIWQQITKHSWERLVYNNNGSEENENAVFESVSFAEAEKILSKNILPLGHVRLLPKMNNVRPIVNLGRRQLMPNGVRSSTNSILRNVLHIMKYENEHAHNTVVPSEDNFDGPLLGSSVFNSIDIYNRYLPFVRLWRSQQHAIEQQYRQQAQLYFASVDVKGAYDSVPHNKLLNVIADNVLSEDEYQVLKFHILKPYLGKLSLKYERAVCLPSEFPQFVEFAATHLCGKYNKSLFTDQVVYHFLDRDHVIYMLEEHIKNNIVICGGIGSRTYYRQRRGIPQGSILSPLLCSYLYADLEKVHLADLPGTCSLNSLDIQNITCGKCEGEEDAEFLTPPLQIIQNPYTKNVDAGSPLLVYSSGSSSGSNNSEKKKNSNAWCYFSVNDVKNSPAKTIFSPHAIRSRNIVQAPSSSGTVNALVAIGESSNKSNSSSIVVSSSSSLSSNSSLPPPIGVLLRLIDDFLYVTSSKSAAKQFLDRYHVGFDDYGIRINPKKTQLSFDCTIGETVYKGSGKIRWCGFVLDTVTLQVMADYSRYWDTHLREKVSKDIQNPGVNLARKLKQTVSWKCNPLIIDGTLNSLFTICLNVYQVFLFCAMKFHCLVNKSLELPTTKSSEHHAQKNCTFLTEVISDIIGYMWVAVQSRKNIIEAMESKCDLTEQKVLYLGLKAFHTVLGKKQSFYATRAPTLLKQLKQMIMSSSFKKMLQLGDNEVLLREATDPKNSSELLEKIKY